MSFNPGENVGPYQIIEQLGQGGMASVYKAYHAALDRYVALKVLHQAFNSDATFIGRFQREARVVAKLEHPNIVPVYDYAEHEGRPYLVMKFIEGDTLKAHMSAGALTSQEIEQVMETVGSALGYAHRQGVLHRDIKPSNVLISNENVLYLADFGLARIAQAGESTLSSDSIMGTPQYISPEQAMGKKDLDGKTDIYSFGVMLYEMVVGQVPFNADTPFSIIHDHIYTPLPLPRSVNPKVPESVQRVLLKSLAKNRDDRYETVEELIGAFKSAWQEAGVLMRGTDITMGSGVVMASSVAPAPVANPLKGQAKKRFGWVWAVAGLAVILCAGFVGLFAVRNILARRGGISDLPPQISAAFTPVAQGPPLSQNPPPDPQNPLPGGGGPSTVIPEDQLSPEIRSASELVRTNPGDPNSHLQLSLAFWNAGFEASAIEEFKQSIGLADPNNADFYLNAALEFKQSNAWPLAASAYLKLIPSYRAQNRPIPEDLKDGFRESAYRGAQWNDLPLIMPFEQVNGFQAEFANVIRGRYDLYNGDLSKAEESLGQAERSSELLPEIHLLRAEIAIKKGNIAEAQNILHTLSGDNHIPHWVRSMAEEIIKTNQ